MASDKKTEDSIEVDLKPVIRPRFGVIRRPIDAPNLLRSCREDGDEKRSPGKFVVGR